jgi:hypothetical protein
MTARNETRNHIPTALAIPSADGARLYIGNCPICGGQHTHGWPPGHRVAHCGDGVGLDAKARGYLVVVDSATKVPVQSAVLPAPVRGVGHLV